MAETGLRQGSYTRTLGASGDENTGIIPRFYEDSVIDVASSNAAGREIWTMVEMVEMLMPGNMLTRPTSKVSDEHRERWPQAYARFKKGSEMVVEGRPIEEWPLLNRAQVRELKSLEFHTVEQVADMSEIAINRIGMGARGLKLAAQAFMDDSEKSVPMRAMMDENHKLKGTVEALQAQMHQQSQLLQDLNARLLQMAQQPNPIAHGTPASFDPLSSMGAAATPATSSLAALEHRMAKRNPKAEAAEPAPAPAKRSTRARAAA